MSFRSACGIVLPEPLVGQAIQSQGTAERLLRAMLIKRHVFFPIAMLSCRQPEKRPCRHKGKDLFKMFFQAAARYVKCQGGDKHGQTHRREIQISVVDQIAIRE